MLPVIATVPATAAAVHKHLLEVIWEEALQAIPRNEVVEISALPATAAVPATAAAVHKHLLEVIWEEALQAIARNEVLELPAQTRCAQCLQDEFRHLLFRREGGVRMPSCVMNFTTARLESR